jgi:hypothetical protein
MTHCLSGSLNCAHAGRSGYRANVNQKFAQELVWLDECRKVPCISDQGHALDGRNNVRITF